MRDKFIRQNSLDDGVKDDSELESEVGNGNNDRNRNRKDERDRKDEKDDGEDE